MPVQLQRLRAILAMSWMAICLSVASAHAQGTAPSPGQPVPRRDFFRIVGAVEVEGERVNYDEIIETSVDGRVVAVLGQSVGDDRLFISRGWILRKLAGGKLLVMQVPQAAGLWTDMKGVTPRDSRWANPVYVEQYLRPPEEFLPQFYWIDSSREPTTAEGYVSESYYEEEFARLKIVSPIRIEFVPPSETASKLAAEQARKEPKFQITLGRAIVSTGWWALNLKPVSKSVWSKMPEVTDVIRSRSDDAVLLDGEIAQKVWEAVGMEERRHWLIGDGRYGVSQPKKYPFPQGEGLLYRRGVGSWADTLIPTTCTQTRPFVCEPLLGRSGYLIYYPSPAFNHGFRLRMGKQVLDVPGSGAVYDRQADALYLLGYDEL